MKTRAKDFLNKSIGPLTVGMMIRNYRTRHSLTQVDLAKKLGLTRRSLSLLENGRKKLSLEKTLEIAKKIKANRKHFALVWFEEESRVNGISFQEISKLKIA